MYTGLGLSIVNDTLITAVPDELSTIRCPGGTGTRCGAQTLPGISVTVPASDIFSMVPKVKDTTTYAPTAPTVFPTGSLKVVPWPLVIGIALAAMLLLKKR